MEYSVKRSFSLIIEAFLKIRIAFVIRTKGKINNRNDSQHNQTSALPIFLPITKTLNNQKAYVEAILVLSHIRTAFVVQ